jgi:hypothetical protein
MHQGFEDEKGMAPAFDEAPGHTTTDSTSSGQITRTTSSSMSNVCGSCLATSNCQTQARVPPSSAVMTYQSQLPWPSDAMWRLCFRSSIGHACSLQRARSTSGAAETRETHGRQLTNRNTSLPPSSALIRQGGLPSARPLNEASRRVLVPAPGHAVSVEVPPTPATENSR